MAVRGLTFGWGVNDADYNVKTEPCPYHIRWRDMIRRAYSEEYKTRNPTYEGTSVNVAWKHFTDFKAWMQTQNWEGLQLDKDILVQGNKEYGPSTCAFVPVYLNTLLHSKKGLYTLPLGVHRDWSLYLPTSVNIYNAHHCAFGSKQSSYLGNFPSPSEAHKAWQLAKANSLESAVCVYKQEPCYRQDVANAIYLRAEMLRDDHANHRETFSL